MDMDEDIKNIIKDRLEGWELVSFLDISIDDVLDIALQEEWINDDNYADVLQYVGILEDDEED